MKKNIELDAQRLEFLLNHMNLRPSVFAKMIGIERPDRLYGVLKRRYGLSEKLAGLIVNAFPHISFKWLVTGLGEPFVVPSSNVNPSDRIRKIFTHLKMSIEELSEKTKIPVPLLNSIIYGVGKPDRELLKVFADAFPQFNPDWILYNKEPMMKTSELSSETILSGYEPLRKGANYLVPGLETAEMFFTISSDDMSPLIRPGDIACGKWIDFKNNILMGKVYYIELRQYDIFRRVLPNDNSSIQLVSTNKEYPAIKVRIEDIVKMALILGVIRPI